MKSILHLIVFVIVVGPIQLSWAHEGAQQQAVKAAEQWLKLIDAGKYDDSWDLASELIKITVKKPQWRDSIGAARKPLGAVVSRRVQSKQYATSLPGAPDGEYVVIQFQTVFENKKSAVETVTPKRDDDGSWRVSGYYIR